MRIQFGIFFENMSYSAGMMASLCRKMGCDVRIRFYSASDTDDQIEADLIKSKPDMVALSFMLVSRNVALRVARVASKLGIKTIAGGIHPSTCPDDVLGSGVFDAVVVGDGMGVLESIIKDSKSLNMRLIQGQEHADDSIYCERFFSEEQTLRLKRSKILEVFTSFGCPFSCSFCAARASTIRRLDLDLVVNSLGHAKEHFGTTVVEIMDDTFTLSFSRVRAFREKIEQRGLSFVFNAQGRTSHFSDELADELLKLGAQRVIFGVETASDRLLKFLNKKTTVADAYRTHEICRKYRIPFYIYLMVGLPTQTREDYEMTLDFIRKTTPEYIHVSHFIPYPGSMLFEYCMENELMPRNWNFDDYLGLKFGVQGVKNLVPGLNGIDHEIAVYYKQQFEQFVEQRRDERILGRLRQADKAPWLLVGTGQYFYGVVETVEKHDFRNFIGFLDLDPEHLKLNYSPDSLCAVSLTDGPINPSVVVVTCHKSGRFFREVIDPFLKDEMQYSGPVVSASTFEY